LSSFLNKIPLDFYHLVAKWLLKHFCKFWALNSDSLSHIQEPIMGFCHIIKQKCSSFLYLPNKVLFRNCPIMHYVHCDMLLALHVCTLESTLVRSPSLGACNSHTKHMSQYFYRPVYFKASFTSKKVSSCLNEHASVRGKHGDLRWT